MEKLGLSAAIMRGREALDPDHPDFDNPDIPKEEKAKMCLDLEAVGDALKAHYELESAVCGKDEGPACSFRSQCPYQRQKANVARADVVIAAHQALFHPLPKEATDKVGLVIVDESWWQAGLVPKRELRLSSFAEEPTTHPVRRSEKNAGKYGRVPRMDEFATNDLHALSAKAQAAFAAMPDGGLVAKETVVATGLTADECALARKLEWRRKVTGLITPGMPPEARRKALQLVAGNASIRRRAAVWSALQELLEGEETHTGRLQMGTRSDQFGVTRVILLHSRLSVREAIAELPILALDATMPVDVVR
jgi:putative DNA primase/helicase